MITVKVLVPQETVDYVQSLDLVVNSKKSLAGALAQQLGIKSNEFKQYEKDYLAVDGKYTLVKQELEAIYVPEELKERYTLTWSLNFQTCQLIMQIQTDAKDKFVRDFVLKPNYEDNIVEKYDVDEDDDCCGSAGCGCSR